MIEQTSPAPVTDSNVLKVAAEKSVSTATPYLATFVQNVAEVELFPDGPSVISDGLLANLKSAASFVAAPPLPLLDVVVPRRYAGLR
jgi:hypothetical protein